MHIVYSIKLIEDPQPKYRPAHLPTDAVFYSICVDRGSPIEAALEECDRLYPSPMGRAWQLVTRIPDMPLPCTGWPGRRLHYLIWG